MEKKKKTNATGSKEKATAKSSSSKFDYIINQRFFTVYGQANYVAVNRKKYINGSQKRIQNYFIYYGALLLILAILIATINALVVVDALINFICIMWIGIAFFMTILLCVSYLQFKSRFNAKGTVEISKKGIIDVTGMTVGFAWEHIKLIGITDDTIVILGDSSIMIILPSKDEMIKEIKVYLNEYKDIVLVDQRRKK